jgi:hypothetical protein
MKTFGKSMLLAGLIVAGGLAMGAKPAQAQVGIGIATPGFSLGIGPQVGYGYYGGFYPPPVVVPAPVVVAPPIYAPRPYFAGYYGGFRGYPGYYRGGYHGHPGYAHYRR